MTSFEHGLIILALFVACVCLMVLCMHLDKSDPEVVRYARRWKIRK